MSKHGPPKDRSVQLLATALFAIALLVCILIFSSCAANRESTRTFSQPKYDMSTHGAPARGRASVQQTWYKRWWFWQRSRRQNSERE